MHPEWSSFSNNIRTIVARCPKRTRIKIRIIIVHKKNEMFVILKFSSYQIGHAVPLNLLDIRLLDQVLSKLVRLPSSPYRLLSLSSENGTNI